MDRTRKMFAALLLLVVTFSSACSPRDEVINVERDDPEMLAAIAKARGTLPQFWQAFETMEHGESNFALKVRIDDGGNTEHFWATDIEKRDGLIWGTINNDPNLVRSVKLGDRIKIPEVDISDWLYMRDGKMVGNETVKPLFKKMPPEEVERVKQMMAQ